MSAHRKRKTKSVFDLDSAPKLSEEKKLWLQCEQSVRDATAEALEQFATVVHRVAAELRDRERNVGALEARSTASTGGDGPSTADALAKRGGKPSAANGARRR